MLYKEKLTMGKSTAIVFITIFLDEVFYLLILPLVLLFIGFDKIFEPIRNLGNYTGDGLIGIFWIAYFAIFAYTIFLALALFIRPEGTNRIIKKLTFTRLFKRWKRRGINLANELLISSREFTNKSWSFWLWTWIATVVAWMGRYLVLCGGCFCCFRNELCRSRAGLCKGSSDVYCDAGIAYTRRFRLC